MARFPELVNVSLNMLDAVPTSSPAAPAESFARRRSPRLSKKMHADEQSGQVVLKFRTIAEKLLKDFVLDGHGRNVLLNAAGETQVGQPIIPLSKADAVSIKILTINQLSSLIPEGWLRVSVGLETDIANFAFVWCNEVDPRRRMRTSKLRVMLVPVATLQRVLDMAKMGERPRVEFPSAELRWDTLVSIAAAYYQDEALMNGFDLQPFWVSTLDFAFAPGHAWVNTTENGADHAYLRDR